MNSSGLRKKNRKLFNMEDAVEQEMLSYAEIAKELNVTASQLQNFVKWWQRNHDKRAFKPDGWGVQTTAPGHRFERVKADRIKDAYIKQRVDKAWKKSKKEF